MTERLQQFLSHLKPGNATGIAALSQKNPDDVVITLAVRTPLTKARKGGLKDTTLEHMLLRLYEGVLKESKIKPESVQDIVVGNVGDPLAGYKARTAALAAGFPVTTSTMSLNRFCSSGLMAVKAIAESIIAGSIDCGLAIGAESMSLSPDNGPPVLSTSVSSHPLAADALQPMGWTSENVAKDFNITREKHDYYAATSYQRAEKAQKAGWFEDEIVPVETTIKDPKTGQETKVTVTQDDGIRYGTTPQSLAKIRQAFPQWGIGATTGGNASQITDGAGAVLLMRRSTAEALGQPIIAKYVHSLVVGLQPRIMGIGPAYAIPKLLETVGLTKEDIDAFEINEAFASMLAYTVETLGLDHEKVNPKGGAIAFGHPLGATGARQVATGLAHLRRTKQKTLVTSMCIGTGMGAAGLFINEAN